MTTRRYVISSNRFSINSTGMSFSSIIRGQFSSGSRIKYTNMDKARVENGDGGNRGDDASCRVTLQQKSVSYGTNRSETPLCNLTMEAFPRMNNYTDDTFIKRPSLGELHGDYNMEKHALPGFSSIPELETKGAAHQGFKLGWIQGVLIPCLLNIWGVMLFLRMPWMVAESGAFQSTIIILISTFICVLTTLSLSALCTNGEVKGGGIYFIISRSLGPEFGASVGIVLAFANAVSASLNTIGFCESLNDLLRQRYHTQIMTDELDSIRLVGIIAIFIMILICAVGIEWESKAQNFLIALILVAMVDFFVGTLMGPQEATNEAQGFVGMTWSVFIENWSPRYKMMDGTEHNFFTIFAIFFPSVTGIQAGANISGDLKDPSSSIPKGTLLSLLISAVSYVGVVLFSAAAAIRNANGDVSLVGRNNTITALQHCPADGCAYGLYNDYSIMQLMSVWGIWIYIGCFAATLSTALTNLLTVPRLLKALGDDHIYPGLHYLAKEYGKNREPYRGFVLTFFVSSGFVLIAQINVIAPLISNFYLASYALINFCTFHAALIRPLGWRPTFTCYNKWLSLLSCILCVIIMFFIDWITSIVTFVTFFILYLLVMYRQPDVNWGSTTQAHLYKSTLKSMYRLINVSEHVKNYQPHILLLSGEPQLRPFLLDFANLITKNSALLICANVVSDKLTYKRRNTLMKETTAYLRQREIKAFYTMIDGLKFAKGADAIMQCCGIGKLRPNVLMMGYKNDWKTSTSQSLKAYFYILHDAFDHRMSVAILRVPPEMHIYRPINTITLNGEINEAFAADPSVHNSSSNSNLNESFMLAEEKFGTMPKDSPRPLKKYKIESEQTKITKLKNDNGNDLNNYPSHEKREEVSNEMTIFNTELKNGVIDVWWLYDDGGLTMLLPYIINTRSKWSGNSMRIFTLTNDVSKIKEEEINMANLLAKFRINYSSLRMLSDVQKPLQQSSRKFFDELIRPYRQDPNSETYVSDEELKSLEDKTNRQLRLKELLVEYSRNSNLVVMSLPMPRRGLVSAPMYTAWLEVLTNDMPPFLLVRGNQTSVLTFYS